MTAHIMQHTEQQAWPMMASWVSATAAQSCGGSTWSKRVASGAIDTSDSWEVRAFAEDASTSGQWPPRSYSCSFCQREFRTAQALGGHMNVHRRERAHANQLASLRTAAARLSAASPGSHTTTVELLSPKAQMQSSMSLSGSVVAHNSSTTPLSSSPPSQESISSSSTAIMMHSEQLGTKPLLQSIPDIMSETLSQQNGTSTISWAPSRGGISYHPYEKSSSRCKPGSQAGARFSFCLNKVMGEHEDTLDLELRLGRSSCAV